MAITWGATSGYFRLGIDVRVSGTTATIIVYGQSVGYGHDWHGTLNLTGSWSGSRAISFYSGTGQTVTKELHRSSASFTGTRTYGANTSYWNGSASVSRSVTVASPKPPAAPSLSRVSRASDTRHTLTWSQSTTIAPTGFIVQRQEWTGTAWGPWREIARPGAAARSYTDTSTRAGAAYQWRVAAYNNEGQSAFSKASLVTPTTPGAPASASASRSGASITVTWPRTQSAPDARIEVQRRQGSGAWTALTTVAASRTSAADESPSTTVPQTYRVRQTAYTPHDGGATLYSTWAETQPISVTSPPAEPNLVAPASYYIAADATTLEWEHYATDGSAQTSAQVSYTPPGGVTRTITVTGDRQSTLVDFTKPGEYKWQARTKGSHASYGPWSTFKTHRAIQAPTVSIITPGEEATARFIAVEWETLQADGWTQNAWEVTLLDAGGLQVGQWTGANAATKFSLPIPLENHKAYQVQVRAAVSGVWSHATVHAFQVEYAPPAKPAFTVSWDDLLGQATVYVDAGQEEGVEATASVSVWRSVTNGATWEPVAEGLEPGSVISDHEGMTAGSTLYRATAYTSIGGEATSETLLEPGSKKLWLGAGAGYARQVGLLYDPSASASYSAQREALRFDGRALPVPVLGPARGGQISLSGIVFDKDTPSIHDVIPLVNGQYVTHLVRVPGLRMYGIIRDLGLERVSAQAWKLTVKLEETEKEPGVERY
ncbi:MAG: fibronectin type III domain-containing protein [Actinomycetaceae bacterium]|nr:fibronectin type III domain-containing protein [Actinomycetaceae bacterium]